MFSHFQGRRASSHLIVTWETNVVIPTFSSFLPRLFIAKSDFIGNGQLDQHGGGMLRKHHLNIVHFPLPNSIFLYLKDTSVS